MHIIVIHLIDLLPLRTGIRSSLRVAISAFRPISEIMNLQLSDEKAAALDKELHDIVRTIRISSHRVSAPCARSCIRSDRNRRPLDNGVEAQVGVSRVDLNAGDEQPWGKAQPGDLRPQLAVARHPTSSPAKNPR